MARRIKTLALSDIAAYRSYLQTHHEEWKHLDGMTFIPISRFYRDRGVFEFLTQSILPKLATEVSARNEQWLYCWSAGCASGEEAYTLSLIWNKILKPAFPGLGFNILATDQDKNLLYRAQTGCYTYSSLKELHESWRSKAFIQEDEHYCIKRTYRQAVAFELQDIRRTMPEGPFHLILCRNLVFTYFDDELQKELLGRIVKRLHSGGYLIIGIHEHLPAHFEELVECRKNLGIFQKK